MTKEEIYSLALRYFNIKYDEITAEDSFEVALCKDFLPSAIEFCLQVAQWSFLIKEWKPSESDSVDGSYLGNRYGHTLPLDFFSIAYVDDEYNASFSIRGNVAYFDHDVATVNYLSKDIDFENFPYPHAFGIMLATQLAVQIAPMVAPDSNVESRIAQQYSIAFSMLQSQNLNARRIANQHPMETVPPHGATRKWHDFEIVEN